MALLDYKEDSTVTVLDHALGRQMIDVGQATNTRDRVCKIVQQLRSATMATSIPHNNEKHQPMGVHAEMSEFYEIFRVISKGTLETILSTTMPVGSSTWTSGPARTPPRMSPARPRDT